MNPDIELQLQTVIKALAEVVAPAVDGTNKAAIEQLHLSIATLAMAQDRVAMQGERARAELANAIALAERLVELGVGGEIAAPLALAGQLRDDPKGSLNSVRSASAQLMAIAADVVDAVDDPALAARVGRAVIEASEAQTDLARAWFVKSGFELEPDKVPDLATLLAKGRA